MHYDVLVVGAGASGLMAMSELVQAGYKVCLLEATEKAGGRIATQPTVFNDTIETGAEFIHGKAPVTIDLLNQASIPYIPVEGNMITVRSGVWFPEEQQENSFDIVGERLAQLKKDCSVRDFLDHHFPANECDELRTAIIQMAEGFDLADPANASVLALKDEWAQLEEEQCRIPGGYIQLIDYLLGACVHADSVIHFSSPVVKIEQKDGKAFASTKEDQYSAEKIIVTVSAGVLQSGAIQFVPALEKHFAAIHQLGFGSVIKILFRFKEAFWFGKQEDTGFLLSNEMIPTWWTQLPERTPLLTGWLGGPRATELSKQDELVIYEKALFSLSNIFQLDTPFLQDQLSERQIICWDNNPYFRGGYSYNTLSSANAKNILQQPVNDCIYFAGEAIYSGRSQATVEAALASGKNVAELIKNSKQ